MHSSLTSGIATGLVPYADGCLNPTQPESAKEIADMLVVSLIKTISGVINTHRIITVTLKGSDPTATSPTWSMASIVPDWLTFNGASATSPNPITLPPVVGKRLEQQWTMEVNVTLSPSSLHERTEPYAIDLVFSINSQLDGTLTMPTQAFVRADPVAQRSVWGVMIGDNVDCSQAARDLATVGIPVDGTVIELPHGSEVSVPFQTCDVEGLRVQHSVPTQADGRLLTAALVDVSTGVQSALSAPQYAGSGAYLVRLSAPKLGRFQLEIRLDGVLVDIPLSVHSVCKAGLYKDDATNTCLKCSDLPNSPICTSDGVTLQTLVLAPNTWRPSLNSSVIMQCKRSKGCAGGSGNLTYDYRRRLLSMASTDGYCKLGHTGPLCSACHANFFMSSSKECMVCKDTLQAAIVSMAGIILFFILLALAYWKRRRIALVLYAGHFFRNSFNAARIKIIFVLYQIIASVM